MAEAEHPDVEAFLRVEVDRAVARYVGKVPPFMLAKLRELAERYWREHPQASRVLHVLTRPEPTRSGVEATAEPDGQTKADGTTKE